GPRAAVRSIRGSRLTFSIPSVVAASLKELARRHEATMFMTLVAAFAALLYRYTESEDILIGTPSTNRDRVEIEGLVGLFVNTLVLRIRASGGMSFTDLLTDVRDVTMEAFANKEIPFERVVDVLRPDRDLGRAPLFEVMFDFQKLASYQHKPGQHKPGQHKPGQHKPGQHRPGQHKSGVGSIDAQEPQQSRAAGLRTSFLELDSGTAKFELGLSMRETWSGLSGDFEYNTDLFDRETVARLVRHFVTLLESVTENPGVELRRLPLSSSAERRLLLEEWSNNGRTRNENSECFPQLFEAQVEKSPNAMAVRCEEQGLTYRELNSRANQVAHLLGEKGIGPEDRVGVCFERSLEMIIAILGVLKAGAAYVPLDPVYPCERLRQQMNEAAIDLVLTSDLLIDGLSDDQRTRLFAGIDETGAATRHLSTDNPISRATPSNLAYVIFTSGSTGAPTGVAIEHHSLVNLAAGLREAVYRLEPEGSLCVTLNGSISFDTSVKQIVQLASGHTLEIVPEHLRWDGEALRDFLNARKVDVLDITPSQLKLLIDGGLLSAETEYPRLLLIGGEAIDAVVWRQLSEAKTVRSFNLYGPTECAVDATICEVSGSIQLPLIGRPISNVEVYVLDAMHEPTPPGVAGELYIGGEGVGRGYLGHPELTAERFIANPFAPDRGASGARLYRTGDRVRYRANGDLEFLGRVDRQLKIRGFRLEPGEIEFALKRHEDVADAVVLSQGEGEEKHLVAYLAARPGCAPTIKGKERYRLPNDLEIVHLNGNETDFLYDEVFERLAYLRNGIVLGEGACVFDVGANIGVFALFANLRSPGARIFAFEPNPRLFEILEANVLLYAANAQLFSCGLSSTARKAAYTFYPGFSSLSGLYSDPDQDKEVVRSFIRREQHEVDARNGVQSDGRNAVEQVLVEELLTERFEQEHFEVDLRTLSDVIREYGVERIDLLKINVEKSELDVLEGIHGSDWAKIDQIAVEVHDIDDRLSTIVELLRNQDYQVQIEQDWRLDESARTNFYVYATRLAPAVTPALKPRSSTRRVLTATGLREFLEARLPEYMVPTEFVVMESLPLTPNGKIDYRLLQQTKRQASPSREQREAETGTERKLERVWAEVLKRERIGIDENFFRIGGHSLLAAQLVARVRETFGVTLALRSLFQLPTIAGLATLIDASSSAMPPTMAALIPDPDHRYEPFPLTEIQEAYWIGRGDAFELGNVASHAYLEIENHGLDVERLAAAWSRLVARHEMLRTIVLADGRQQTLQTTPDYRIRELDLRGLDQATQSARLNSVRDEMSHQVLPSDRWPLFEIRASHLDDTLIRLHISLDALIADAMSIFRIFSEWRRFYHEPTLKIPSPSLTFRDYVLACRKERESGAYAQAKQYWVDRLETLPPAPALPIDPTSAALKSPRFTRRTSRLDAADWKRIKEVSAKQGLTPSVTLLAAYAEILNAWSRSPRFTINLTLFNRLPLHPEVNQIIGDFTSLTLLEVDHTKGRPFKERAAALQSQLWQDIDHHQFSGLAVMRALSQRAGGRDRAAMPVVFTSALALDSLVEDSSGLEWIGELTYSVGQTPQVWLDHQVFELSSGLVFNWDAVDDLFEPGVIDDMFEAYTDLLKQLCTSDDVWTMTELELSRAECQTGDERASPKTLTSAVKEGGTMGVTMEQLGGLLESLRGLERDQFAIAKYRYPSAGSLYPVQTYIRVRSGGIKGVDGGYYYYDPMGHEMVRLRHEAAAETAADPARSSDVDESFEI
ncbi:MAG: amino acid adenylation domain-containing protein, partial [Acidobacteriota bacterium]